MPRSLIRNVSVRYTPDGRGGASGWLVGLDVLGRRYGFDKSTVYVYEGPNRTRYLDRWILYLAGYTLRVHRFWRGDDDRASHTHPWWFVTFPLTSYVEKVFTHGRLRTSRVVAAWRCHYRPADFEHYVVKRFDRYMESYRRNQIEASKPWWTIVLTGRKRDDWGFYPKPDEFVNWKDYK